MSLSLQISIKVPVLSKNLAPLVNIFRNRKVEFGYNLQDVKTNYEKLCSISLMDCG